MFVVYVVASEDDEPKVVGPFPDPEWAKRWVDRVGHRYFHCTIGAMLSPRLLDPSKTDPVVFDPEKGIDLPSGG